MGCRYNLFLDVRIDNGGLIYTHGANPRTKAHLDETSHPTPRLDPLDVPADRSCALDVAEQGVHNDLEVAQLMGVTRQRVNMVAKRALVRLRVLPEGDDFVEALVEVAEREHERAVAAEWQGERAAAADWNGEKRRRRQRKRVKRDKGDTELSPYRPVGHE